MITSTRRHQIKLVAAIVTQITGMARAIAAQLAEVFPDTARCPHPVTTAAYSVVRHLVVLESTIAAAERSLPRG